MVAADHVSHRVRMIVSWVTIGALVFAGLYFSASVEALRTEKRRAVETVRITGSMLAQTCDAAPESDLAQRGLRRGCTLARNGQIAAAVEAYCENRSYCRGPRGLRGPRGFPGYPVSFTTADGATCTDPDGDRRYLCAFPPTSQTPPPH